MNKDDWADRIKELLWEAASAGRSGDNGTEIEFLFDKLMVAVKQLCAEAREQERLRTLEAVRQWVKANGLEKVVRLPEGGWTLEDVTDDDFRELVSLAGEKA